MSSRPTDGSGTAPFPLLRDQWPPSPEPSAEASGDPLTSMLRGLGVLAAKERVLGIARAGDGNMNLTLRVRTTRGTMILKQARPWVEKYPQIPAPVERTRVEHAFYRRVAGIPGVADRMPRVLGFDREAYVLVLEDLGRGSDLTPAYRGVKVPESMLRELALYAVSLHHETRGSPEPELANTAMKRLNHEHIFLVPLDRCNGLDLDRHEPGLKDAAAGLIADREIARRIHAVGRRYLGTGECLVHGDFFPGSWIETSRGVRVIDPEFCFYGDAEFDLGVALAHMRIADESGALARYWRGAYLDACASIGAAAPDERQVVEYASVEIIRRIAGVAQLPPLPSTGSRARLLSVARTALHDPSPEALLA